MRDVGTLVWVVLVVIGVISSIASSVRKASRGLPATRTPAVPAGIPPQVWATPGVVPPPQAAPAAPSFPSRAAAPTVVPVPPPPRRPDPLAHAPEKTHRPRRIFAGRNELVRAVIAAEVLGKPRALRDEHFSA